MSYPRYISHKEVGAAKIEAVERGSDGGLLIVLEKPYVSVRLSHGEARNKPDPSPGWYLIDYGSYVSFSPPKAFEQGYTAVTDEAPDPSVAEWKASPAERVEIEASNARLLQAQAQDEEQGAVPGRKQPKPERAL